jgi:electron transfer flavoprotein alpha/beta subunit
MSTVVLLRAVRDPELAGGIRGSSYRLDGPSEDAIALGLRLRAGAGGSLHGIAMGPGEWDAALRDAVSLGLDRVSRLWSPSLAEGHMVSHARELASRVPAETRAIIAGGVATDHGSGLLPFALSELLGWPIIERAIDAAMEESGAVALSRAPGGRRTTYRLPERVVLIAASGYRLPYPTTARKLAARRAPIPECAPAAASGAIPSLVIEGFGPARPVTRHLLRPSATGGAGGRLRQLMGGGATAKSPARGGPESGGGEAAQLADLLDKEGLLG